MKITARQVTAAIGTAALLFLQGCGKPDEPTMAAPRNPQEAASQLETVFATAAPAIRQTVDTASSAMRNSDYAKAIVALQALRSGTNVTFEQGLAVYYSGVAMEKQLISASDAGDENARRAYKLLKELKRN